MDSSYAQPLEPDPAVAPRDGACNERANAPLARLVTRERAPCLTLIASWRQPAPVSSGDDIRSFAVAVQQNEAALRSLALRLSGNTADAEDLVQDSLERALRHASRFRPGSNLRAWLCSILHHRFIDQCRTRACGRSVELPLESLEDSLAAPVEEELPPWATISPEQFREALSALPEPFQSAYRLHALEQVSYDEIATRLSIPRNTVGTRLLRARRKLLELLKRSLASRSG